MFENPFAPYLAPYPSLLRAEPWMIEINDEESKTLDSFIGSWTQGTDIFLTRVITIDRDEIINQAALPSDAELAISVSWVSKATKFKRMVYRGRIDNKPLHIRVRLSGDEVSSTVSIRTSLILNQGINGLDPWVARYPGSILLQDEKSISLEGDGASFPMAVINFASTAYPDSASWYLTSSTDLEASFTSTFQVMINEKDKHLVKAIEASKPNREQSLLLDELIKGVMATILEIAYSLHDNDSLRGPNYENGSVGAVLYGFIEDSNHLQVDINQDPTRIAHRRALFESLAREIGAGRMFN